MYRNLFSGFSLVAALYLFTGGCAKINSPAGGPRDRQPPVVVKSSPENGATNFNGNSLVITFDEYVQLDGITEKLMISPPMKKKPRVYIKGKGVNVDFEEELKDSTTYTFYFQDAIKDINEGNIIEDFQFVFSTGPVIDSLSVTGNVYNAFDLEVPAKTMVLLYSNPVDSAVIKEMPDYISNVDQKGFFRINNVRSGQYRLYALTDVDNSKNYNLPDEAFAFMNSVIDVTPEKNFIPVVEDTTTVRKDLKKPADVLVQTGQYQLFLFTAQKKDHYLSGSSRELKYELVYTLSLPPDTMNIELSIQDAANDAYFTEKSRNGDTITVWITDSTIYSRPQITTYIKYPFTDTLKVLDYKLDTIMLRYMEPRVTRASRVTRNPYTVDANIRSSTLKPGQQIVFSSRTPFRKADETRISIYDMADSNRTKLPVQFRLDSINSTRYYLEARLTPGKKYLLVADSASFGNIYNENIDSTGIQFSVRKAEEYNKLTLNIVNSSGPQIFQLLNNSEKLVSEKYLQSNGEVVYSLLESGSYRVRLIYDLNGDKKWNTGDFLSGLQPEPVSYFPKEMEFKIGRQWEFVETWNVEAINFKDPKLRKTPKSK